MNYNLPVEYQGNYYLIELEAKDGQISFKDFLIKHIYVLDNPEQADVLEYVKKLKEISKKSPLYAMIIKSESVQSEVEKGVDEVI
jgi:hypothetical protein